MRDINDEPPCYFVKFGILVTGETEEENITKLFKTLAELGVCSFQVIKRIGQRSPITSEKKKLKMVGSGKLIPDKDAEDIGFPARNFLRENPCSYVLLIDDLENDRRIFWEGVFNRYRQALNQILLEKRGYASVHFLVNMLEAYYFADANSINKVLKTSLSDYDGDVETIKHPKNELKAIFPGFDEKQHGGEILNLLDILHVLSCDDACGSLRTLLLWCLNALKKTVSQDFIEYDDRFLSAIKLMEKGKLCEITSSQISDSFGFMAEVV